MEKKITIPAWVRRAHLRIENRTSKTQNCEVFVVVGMVRRLWTWMSIPANDSAIVSLPDNASAIVSLPDNDLDSDLVVLIVSDAEDLSAL